MRLSDIFGISVDEILNSENKEQNAEIQPNESYRFTFLKQELNEIYRLQRKSIYKRPIIFTGFCILMIVFFIGLSAPDVMIGFSFGMFLIGAVSHIKGIRAYSKAWKSSTERICKSVYEYKVFENYISVNIYRENERIRESKCFFTDIEQIQQFGKWLFLQFGGQSFIIRKSDLKENSAFYSYMYKNPSKIIEPPVSNKWRTISIILFVASLLSIMGALALVGAVSNANGLFVENMWLFFLLTPIPIASIIFGFVLKSKGYKYKKNITVGFIMTFFYVYTACLPLCINDIFFGATSQKRKSHPNRDGFFLFSFARCRTRTQSRGTVRWTVPATSANTGGYIYFLPMAENANRVLSSAPNN